jgi:hypothetical protein
MSKPIFVRTSRGYLNLTSIQRIEEDGKWMRFYFSEGDDVRVPLEEGIKIISKMAMVDLTLED